MSYIQPARPGAWGRFSTPQVVNKTIISGSFNNYNSGFGGGCFGGGMMNCGMDYGMMGGCCGGGKSGFWGGMLGGFLGGIFGGGGGLLGGLFGGGGGGMSMGGMTPYGQIGGGYPTGGAAGTGDGLDSLRELYPDNKFSTVGNKFVCVTKDGKQITGKSPEELLSKLGGGAAPAIETKSGDGDADGEKTIKGKAQLQEECDVFNAKNNGKGTLEVITDPNDANFGEYRITYKNKDGQDVSEVVKTVTDAQNKLNALNKPADDDPPPAADGGDKGKPATKAEFEKLIDLAKLPSGYKYEEGKGFVDKDGNIYKTPLDLMEHLNGDNTFVQSKDFKIGDLEGQNIIAHDESKNIADITGDVKVNKEGNSVTINGHTYTVTSSDDQFVYLNDPDARSTDGKGQTYILEKTPSGGYRLSQYEFTKKTVGYDVSAH